MTCERFQGWGWRGVVCARGRRAAQRCCVCGEGASRVCDGPAPAGVRRGLCSRGLCRLHAVPHGDGRDLCPQCDTRAEKAGVQLGLFEGGK